MKASRTRLLGHPLSPDF